MQTQSTIITKTIIHVQLVEAEYDCQCGETHRYTEGQEYDCHQDLMIGNKRWICKEVEAVSQS